MKSQVIDLEGVSNKDVEALTASGAPHAGGSTVGATGGCGGCGGKGHRGRWRIPAETSSPSIPAQEAEYAGLNGYDLNELGPIQPIELRLPGNSMQNLQTYLQASNPLLRPQAPRRRSPPIYDELPPPDRAYSDDRSWRAWLGAPSICPLPVPFSPEEQLILRDVYDHAEDLWRAPLHGTEGEGGIANPVTGLPWWQQARQEWIAERMHDPPADLEFWGGSALLAYNLARNASWRVHAAEREATWAASASPAFVMLRRKLCPTTIADFFVGVASTTVVYVDRSDRGNVRFVAQPVQPWYRDPTNRWVTCCAPDVTLCQWWEGAPGDTLSVGCNDDPLDVGNCGTCIRISPELHGRIETARAEAARLTGEVVGGSAPATWNALFMFHFGNAIRGLLPVPPVPELLGASVAFRCQLLRVTGTVRSVAGVEYIGEGEMNPALTAAPYTFCECRNPVDPAVSSACG